MESNSSAIVRSTSSPNSRGRSSIHAERTLRSFEVVPRTTSSRARPWSVSKAWTALIALNRTSESESDKARSANSVAIRDSLRARAGRFLAATRRTSTSASFKDHEMRSQTAESPLLTIFLSKAVAFFLSSISSSSNNESTWSTTTSGQVSHNPDNPAQAASIRNRTGERSSFAKIDETPDGNTGEVRVKQRLAALRTLISLSSNMTESQSNKSSDLRTATSGSTSKAATRSSTASDSKHARRSECA